MIKSESSERGLRKKICEMMGGAKKEIIYIESPIDGLSYIVVDRKDFIKFIDPSRSHLFWELSVKKFKSLDPEIDSTEFLYATNLKDRRKEKYVEFERLKDGSYRIKVFKELKDLILF